MLGLSPRMQGCDLPNKAVSPASLHEPCSSRVLAALHGAWAHDLQEAHHTVVDVI